MERNWNCELPFEMILCGRNGTGNNRQGCTNELQENSLYPMVQEFNFRTTFN